MKKTLIFALALAGCGVGNYSKFQPIDMDAPEIVGRGGIISDTIEKDGGFVPVYAYCTDIDKGCGLPNGHKCRIIGGITDRFEGGISAMHKQSLADVALAHGGNTLVELSSQEITTATPQQSQQVINIDNSVNVDNSIKIGGSRIGGYNTYSTTNNAAAYRPSLKNVMPTNSTVVMSQYAVFVCTQE